MAENMELELEEQVRAEAVVAADPAASKKKKSSGKKTKKGKKKKKKYGGIIFAIFMLLYIGAALAGIYYGLGFLWNYMEAYEASRPNNTVNAYMEALTLDHIVDMNQDVIDQIDHNLQTEEECRQIMLDELNDGVRHAKKVKDCTDTRMVYVLKSGSKVIGEFAIEANAPDEYGFTTWSVTSEEFDLSYLIGETHSITAPDICTVSVNGVALDESYIIVDNIPYEAVKEYYDDYEFPCQVTYEAGPLLGDFQMIITNDAGEELTFDENTDWSVYYLNCTQDELKELDEFASLFLERYVAFAGSNKNTRHTTYNSLIKLVVEGSDLATRLKDAVAGLQFGQSKGDEIVSIVTHLQIKLGEKYLVDLTYDVDTTGKEGVVRTTTNARILVARTENGLKVESIILY